MLKTIKIMKRIILISILFLTVFACKAQYQMLSTLNQNIEQYQGYLRNGPVTKAQVSGEKLIQGLTFWNEYMSGSLTGRAGIMDTAKTAFDLLYGKTHTAPTISIGALSYLKIDSLSFDDGASWVNYIYPKDSITSWIGDAGLDTSAVESLISLNSIDSTFLNSHLQIFRDSLDVTNDIKSSVLDWIDDSVLSTVQLINLIKLHSINTDSVLIHIDKLVDTLDYVTSAELTAGLNGVSPNSDSSWISTTTDTTKTSVLKIGDVIITNTVNSNLLSIGSTTKVYLINGTIYDYNGNGAGIGFTSTPTSTEPYIRPKYTDVNTGYSWGGSDKLALVAGGQSTFTSAYVSSKKVNWAGDSLSTDYALKAPRGYFDSIYIQGSWKKYLTSLTTLPADSGLIYMRNNGTTASYSFTGIGSIGNSDSINVNNLVVNDSAYLGYLSGSTRGTRWLTLTESGKIDSCATENASWGLKKELTPIRQMLSDTLNGEIASYYKDRKTGLLTKRYGIKEMEIQYIPETLLGHNEAAYRYIGELEDKVTDLEKRISIIEQLMLKNQLK
jgi:hypothetical protein